MRTLRLRTASVEEPQGHGHQHQHQQQQQHQVCCFCLAWISPEDNKDRKDRHLPPSSRLRKVLPSLLAARPTAHENINTIPNWLTASRLVAAPFIGYCILHDHHAWTLGLFAYAGITDLLDGWIARRWNLGTVVGTIIDPMADKILMTVLCVALAAKGALPVWLAVIILGRDIALAISAIYYRWISLPPPKTFSRYWDFSLPSAEVRPTTISKYNTALQLGLMGMTTVAPVMPAVDFGTSLVVMQCVVAATTVWSGASYVFSKDAVKILHHPKPQPPAAERDNEETEKEHDKKEKKL
ncbi:hypothetical protein B0T19DRAFT_440057 [Cercophora scortea]|uniref:Cardiolipin synthase n=1 Tax=Cercophora scortea TaxID=314031 RepID=A0AAE0IY13_9PEZI|nr:hypothetical protein B0T19DRAFT_440057 [Cercophora scortea]